MNFPLSYRWKQTHLVGSFRKISQNLVNAHLDCFRIWRSICVIHSEIGGLTLRALGPRRRGKNTQLPLPDLLRQSIYSRLAGYEDLNDAERLSQDPTFRLIGSEKIWDRGAALPSR